jgi:hypothetical protein
METVDELGQDTQKFHNYQRNSARQQQQKDAYLMKRVSIEIFRCFQITIINYWTRCMTENHLLSTILFRKEKTKRAKNERNDHYPKKTYRRYLSRYKSPLGWRTYCSQDRRKITVMKSMSSPHKVLLNFSCPKHYRTLSNQ